MFGNNLWRMGIFGSRYRDGHGPRMGYQKQILNATEASMPLLARKVINLMFLISVQFDVSTVGCNHYKYLCLEFAKGDNASPDFPFRSSNGKAVFIGCRTAPCNELGKWIFIRAVYIQILSHITKASFYFLLPLRIQSRKKIIDAATGTCFRQVFKNFLQNLPV